MVGAEAMVATAGTQLTFSSYRLDAKDADMFARIDNLVPVKNTGGCEFSDSGSTWTAVKFTRSLASGSNPLSLTDATPMVIAYGTQDRLTQHASGARDAFFLNLVTGEVTYPKVGSATQNVALRKAHGALMFAGFGVFIPVGIIIARYGKEDLGESWFLIHLLLQLSGYFIAFAAFLIALYMVNGTHFTTKAHSQLGLAVVVSGVVQLTLGFFRPAHVEKGFPTPPLRFVWEILHKWLGRTLNLVVVITIFFGLYQYSVPLGLYIAYAVFVGVFILLIIALEIRKRILKRKHTKNEKKLAQQLHENDL